MFPAGIYLLKGNNRNTRARCDICSKLTIRHQNDVRRRSGVFIVNFEHISHLCSIVNFEHVIAGWGKVPVMIGMSPSSYLLVKR